MEDLIKRVIDIVETCWQSFSAKVGHGLINVNKEASMQLHFAYILKNSVDLIIYHPDESVIIELETGISVNGRNRECDIIIQIVKGNKISELPIEMKCYKTKSSSGGLRGAQDLFRYGIYEDLELLESYVGGNRLLGIQLTMTDSRNFIYPKSKTGKSWHYDISDGTVITDGIKLNTPIGGKQVSMHLKKTYEFKWMELSGFYFLKIQGK